MYKVYIEHRAEKELGALHSEIRSRVIKAIEALKQNPRPHGTKKLFVEGGWRIKISDYRVLYTIDDKEKLVNIYRIKHRRDAYR